ncbi:2-oxoglutarate receptor 1-like [Acipenser ruthenus]|uniref:2-oxoglutarate receptor 1-like n=1 Tax=Acipenser ruthenus TaxID=7906 RepID=UPI00155F6E20|nr:2-oxoglutarate receptor 1-like [Acipenser ruthenus]
MGDNASDHASNCTNVDTLMKRYYLPAIYGTIFIVGLLGNLLAITVYLVKMRPWKSSSIIMFNLVVTDFLYMLTLPFLVYYHTNGDSWAMGDFMCRFVRFTFQFSLYRSILFLTCLSVFRYIAVVYPYQTQQVQKKRWGILVCIIVWAIAAVAVIPMTTMISVSEMQNVTQCLDFASSEVDTVWWYSWLLTVLGFLVPLVIVCMCYFSIVRALSTGPHTQSECRLKARCHVVLIIVVFVLCYLPFHISRGIRVQTNKPGFDCLVMTRAHAAYIFFRPIAGLHTFFNLALNTTAGDQFQKACSELFSCFRCESKRKEVCKVVVIS